MICLKSDVTLIDDLVFYNRHIPVQTIQQIQHYRLSSLSHTLHSIPVLIIIRRRRHIQCIVYLVVCLQRYISVIGVSHHVRRHILLYSLYHQYGLRSAECAAGERQWHKITPHKFSHFYTTATTGNYCYQQYTGINYVLDQALVRCKCFYFLLNGLTPLLILVI